MEKYELLEKEFAEWMGLDPERMVAVSSGTAALHTALEALQLPQGASVVIPDFAMVACPRAVTLAGLKPKFADVGTDLLLDPTNIAGDLVTLRAVMPVHTYGRRCNMEVIADKAEMFALMVVEDLAEAHGVRPHPETDAACWSFYRNKIISGEEGGAVYFKCKDHASYARQLKNIGFTPAHDFAHIPRGHNYRLANVLAEIAIDNLRRVNRNVSERRRLEAEYDRRCSVEWKMPPRDAVWVYDLRIPGLTSEVQDKIVKSLNEVGIAARHGFKPLRRQQEYAKGQDTSEWQSDVASREVIYLPVHPGVTEKQIELAFEVIRANIHVSPDSVRASLPQTVPT